MLDFLFDQFFLLAAQVELVHLNSEFVPGFFLLDFLSAHPTVFGLYIGFDTFSTFTSAIRGLELLAGLGLVLGLGC